jgi:FkbM family methyltransferase
LLNTTLTRLLAGTPAGSLEPELLKQLAGQDARVSFSQSGEDCVAAFYLAKLKEKGVVVDIGAYHPFRFSNTFLFHLMGWKCICVDASPDSIALLKKVRPSDTSVCALVSDRKETMKFFSFAEGAWNTTNAAIVNELEGRETGGTKLVKSTEVEAIPIMDLLDQTVGQRKIDLLDIDVEGMDLRLVSAIDFRRYAPAVILAELSRAEIQKSPLREHLASGGYSLHGHCGNTAVLVRDAAFETDQERQG